MRAIMGTGYHSSSQINCFKCNKSLNSVLACAYTLNYALSAQIYFCAECFEDMCPENLIEELKRQKKIFDDYWNQSQLSLPYNNNPIPYASPYGAGGGTSSTTGTIFVGGGAGGGGSGGSGAVYKLTSCGTCGRLYTEDKCLWCNDEKK